MSPKVSIVMSVFNGASYLRRAIDSILGQSFTDFKFIIIDDGSTDDTPSILQEYADERIRLFSNDTNLGLTRSLNKGIEAARGEFLARLDVDDVAQRNRLERQAACLEADRELSIVGSICAMVDEEGRNVGLSDEPSSDIELRWRSLTGVPFQHPSVMIRKDVLDRHRLKYDEQYETAQDYDLWVRLLGHAKGMNIQDPLVTRTRHQKSIGHRLKDRQSINHARVALGAMEEIWPGHPFTVKRFNDLRLVLAVVPPGGGITNKDRCLLLADYVGLLENFLGCHANSQGTEELCRRWTVFIAYLALRSPGRLGMLSLLVRLRRLQPDLPFAFAAWALRGFLRARSKVFDKIA